MLLNHLNAMYHKGENPKFSNCFLIPFNRSNNADLSDDLKDAVIICLCNKLNEEFKSDEKNIFKVNVESTDTQHFLNKHFIAVVFSKHQRLLCRSLKRSSLIDLAEKQNNIIMLTDTEQSNSYAP